MAQGAAMRFDQDRCPDGTWEPKDGNCPEGGGGDDDAESKANKPVSVNVEAKPNENPELLAKWEKLSEEEKVQATNYVLSRMTDAVLLEVGGDGTIVPQRGGWDGESSPSFAVMLEDPALAIEVADLLGDALHQEGMFIMSKEGAPGLSEGEAVTIRLPEGYTTSEIDALYEDTLHPILGRDGERAVIGHSTQGSHMTIGVDAATAGMTADELSVEILNRVPDLEVQVVELHTALRERGENYAIDTPRDPAAGGSPAESRRDRIRSKSEEAYRDIFRQIEDARARGDSPSPRAQQQDAPGEFSLALAADQERCPDGRWAPKDGNCPPRKPKADSGGEDKPPKDDKGRKPAKKARTLAEAANIVGNKGRKGASMDIHTEADLYAAAPEALSSYQEVLDRGRGLNKRLGGTVVDMAGGDTPADIMPAIEDDSGPPVVIIGPMKKRKRAREKVAAKYKGNWSDLHDTVRATVAVNKEADLPQVIADMGAELAENGWEFASQLDDRFSNPMPGGYRDIKCSVRHNKSGLVGEIQFNTKAMMRAKQGPGHKMYEESRSIEAKAKIEKRDMTSGEQSRYDTLQEESEILYNAAWKQGL